MISRVCEEFHCDPLRAEQLLDDDGARVLTILDLRVYHRAYAAHHSRDGLSDARKRELDRDPLVQEVAQRDAKQPVAGDTDDDAVD